MALQRIFASAMLAADPVASGVYYVDDHFVPYTGPKPITKGSNDKRGKAEQGRADPRVTAHDGPAVYFVTGEPSGLSVTLPKALAELKKAAGPSAKIMLGFDRSSACPQVFARCRDQGVLGDLPAGAARDPGHAPGRRRSHLQQPHPAAAWAEERARLKEYGGARQSPCSSTAGSPADPRLRVVSACPAEILSWLKSPVGGGELPRVRQQELRSRRGLDYIASVETTPS